MEQTPSVIRGQDMEIRPVRPGEAAGLRELRLRALRDAPNAYFASLESEESLPLSYWEDWARSKDRVMLVAMEDGKWLGMAGAFAHSEQGGTVSLWVLWVAPGGRGLGFVPTGERRSMASDPTRVGIFMARPL